MNSRFEHNNYRNRAIGLLQHYFELTAKKSGLKWNHDNDTEVADIVDLIILAANAEQAQSHGR
jgi:hypothetical protein